MKSGGGGEAHYSGCGPYCQVNAWGGDEPRHICNCSCYKDNTFDESIWTQKHIKKYQRFKNEGAMNFEFPFAPAGEYRAFPLSGLSKVGASSSPAAGRVFGQMLDGPLIEKKEEALSP